MTINYKNFGRVRVRNLKIGDLLVFGEDHWFLVLGIEEVPFRFKIIFLEHTKRKMFHVFNASYVKHDCWDQAIHILGR